MRQFITLIVDVRTDSRWTDVIEKTHTLEHLDYSASKAIAKGRIFRLRSKIRT